MASKYVYFITGDDSFHSCTDISNNAQTFTTDGAFVASYVKLKCYRVGSPGNVTVSLHAVSDNKPTGSALATVTVASSTISTDDSTWATFTFDTAYQVSATTSYAIVIDMASADASNQIRWRVDSDNGYSGGNRAWWTDVNGFWTADLTDDFMFEVWGDSAPPSDKVYSRNLIAIGGSEVWYESAPGTMSEFADANMDIDTAIPLTAVEAYQKIFIANRAKLKVADFVNSKLSTTDAGSVVCTPGMTLTGGTSTATMIVDYVDAVTDDAAMNVYGKNTSTSTFSSGETVTGTNSAGGTVSFVTSAAEDTGPHWYNWTVFGNDTTTYGTMLSEPTLVCLYRGRLVISGDKRLPHAWQMTKVGNPWKVLYDFTNDGDLSGVSYANNLVGEIGDVITALIPYKDDLLIFGGSQSIYILIGDPLSSGTLAEVTRNTGIYGPKAWCIDNKKNLYFLGSDGIYRMPISETSAPPENISKDKLPNLISDLALDQDVHRVVLSFDPEENGIIVSKTVLEDGENTNYFYSLMTGGFFPETYPDSCGIYCSYYYPATNSTYKKFLVGGADGYIREFDNTTKNDATTSSTSAISSYLTIIQKLGTTEFTKGMLRELSSIVSGGASSGDFSDTDAVSWALYPADDAETALEDIKDAATAFTSGTWSTVGKQNKSRPRMRGVYAGIKLYNSTASQTWSLEKLYGEVIEKGKS